MKRRQWLRTSPWLALLACVACTVSPQPLPPPVPTPVDVSIDIAGITLVPTGDERVTLRGAQGTVRVANRPPSAGKLDIVNLTTTSAAITLDVASDGSFEGTLPAHLVDELRLQALVYETRSHSLDITGRENGDSTEVTVPARALGDCLTLTPAVDLDVGRVQLGQSREATLHIDNACSSEVTVAGAELRFADPTWQVATTLPVSVPQAGALDIHFVFTPVDETNRREIVFLDLQTPGISGRRPITLLGQGKR